jgi:hypothetical protein
MARTLSPLVLFLLLAGAGLHRAAAQSAPTAVAQPLNRAEAGQHDTQALVPAQPPVLAQPPGFIPHALPANASTPRPQARAKTSSQLAHPNVQGTNQTAKPPEQTKVAQIYRGQGYFDAALAEKLRPMLAKTFGPSMNDRNPVSRIQQSASGNSDSVRIQDEGPKKVAVADPL